MNGYPSKEMVESIRQMYPVGTRIKLCHMSDPYAPVPEGTEGVVTHIDSIGTLGMKWDNGRTLGVVPGEDSFVVLSRPEQKAQTSTMTMGGM